MLTTITTPPDIMHGTRPCTDVCAHSAYEFVFDSYAYIPETINTFSLPVCQDTVEKFACAWLQWAQTVTRSCEC